MIFDKSGLADGADEDEPDVDELPDAPGLALLPLPELPEPVVAPVLPDPLVLPDVLLPEPPVLDCAAAIAGANATTATRKRRTNFRIVASFGSAG